MKAVQTFWTNGSLNNSKAGWINRKFHLLSWALSASQLKKHFSKVELVSDATGKQLLVDELGLPYTSVDLTLEYFENQFPSVWVLKKIESYSLQRESFVHVDSDAYLFSPLQTLLTNAQLLAQNVEFNHPYYIQGINHIRNSFTNIPEYFHLNNQEAFSAVNAGIIGGQNYQFFKSFKSVIYEFLEVNRKAALEMNQSHLNVIVEQFIFKHLAKEQNVEIKYLLTGEFDYCLNYDLYQFTELPSNCDYIHLMNYKENPNSCENLANRLFIENEELYNRVVKLEQRLSGQISPIVPVENMPYSTDPAVEATTFEKYICSPVPSQFHRTIEGLCHLQIAVPSDFQDEHHFATFVSKSLNTNEPFDHYQLVQDAFHFEQMKRSFLALSQKHTSFLKNREHLLRTNSKLKLKQDDLFNEKIRLPPGFERIITRWNWSEANEFHSQAFRLTFSENAALPDSYHETVILAYNELSLIREYRLDPLEIILVDAVESNARIQDIIEICVNSILEIDKNITKSEISDGIMKRIRFFLYHGVLIFD